MDGWKYYNHAMIPTCAPHETPELTVIESGEIWKNVHGKKTPLLARWTTDFDCKEETKWWYIIKDTPFDIKEIKAKRRYEINKGRKNFEVYRLKKPMQYAEALYDVQIEAFSAYPEKYRPAVDKNKFIQSVSGWSQENVYVYGAFFREDGRLCGYAYLTGTDSVVNFNVLKTRPGFEKYAVNAVIVNQILEDFADYLKKGCYICDGARSIQHETAFQDYLEKYFGFRKAYCKLHVKYNPKLEYLILLLYRFRSIFRHGDGVGLIHSMNGVFAMQEIIEKQESEK